MRIAVKVRMKFVPASLSTYRVRWHIDSGPEPLDHLVLARNPAHARRISTATLRSAAPDGFKGWKIDTVD